MYSQKATKINEIKYVLERLNPEAVAELKVLFGNDYKNQAFQIIRATRGDKFIIKLEKTNEPVGIYGIIPMKQETACGIFFLTTSNIHKGNKIKLLKGAKKQIAIWEQKYETIMDSCHKTSETIKKWLKLLGFKPSGWEDNNIEVYYKGVWSDEIEKGLSNNE